MRKLAQLEDTHWWYAERRYLLRRELRGLRPGVAVDVGAAGGGNTRVLRDAGWRAVAVEYGADGAEVAHERRLSVVRGDACALPFRDCSVDLVVAFDVLEHLEDDAAAVAEVRRVLRPGGTYLVAVPADMTLWSAHDEAVGHVRRYARAELLDLVASRGLHIEHMRAWNVLLRPVARWHRRKQRGSDLQPLHPAVNTALRAAVTLERVLPVRSGNGVSLLLRASNPDR